MTSTMYTITDLQFHQSEVGLKVVFFTFTLGRGETAAMHDYTSGGRRDALAATMHCEISLLAFRKVA